MSKSKIYNNTTRFITCRKGEQRNKKHTRQTENSKMVERNPTTLITTLNVNGPNTPIKRQRLSAWIKNRPSYMFSIKNGL